MLLLAGVHPNCESMTVLVSDGKQYRGINHYLKKPFSQGGRRVRRPVPGRSSRSCKRLDPHKFSSGCRGSC